MTNSADPNQLASSEANWSGSTLFAKIGLVVFSKRRVNLPIEFGYCVTMSENIPMDMHLVKILISLYICTVWPKSALCILDNQVCKVSTWGQWRLLSDCVDLQLIWVCVGCKSHKVHMLRINYCILKIDQSTDSTGGSIVSEGRLGKWSWPGT